jgi:O-glycosyl hydrolase
MFKLKNILNTYGTKIKYALWLVFFIAMIFAIRTYVNYLTVMDSIETVNARTASVQNEMDYAQNFQKKYLASDYGYLFLAHDNSMIFDGEEIILFKSSEDAVET